MVPKNDVIHFTSYLKDIIEGDALISIQYFCIMDPQCTYRTGGISPQLYIHIYIHAPSCIYAGRNYCSHITFVIDKMEIQFLYYTREN